MSFISLFPLHLQNAISISKLMLRVRLLNQRTMTIRLLFSALLMIIFVVGMKAQTITGKVVDSKQQPIEGATIVLQTRDSTYMDAVISNADGSFWRIFKKKK